MPTPSEPEAKVVDVPPAIFRVLCRWLSGRQPETGYVRRAGGKQDLPSSSQASETAPSGQRDWRIAGVLAGGFFLFFLLFNHGKFTTTDEAGAYETTRALYENGDLAVPPVRHSFAGRDGRRYSQYAIGQSVLALPFYGLGRLARATLPDPWIVSLAGPRDQLITDDEYAVFGGDVEIFFVGLYPPLICSLLVALFFRLERRLGASPASAAAASVLVGATSYLAMMSIYFLRHATESVCVLGALYGYACYRDSGSLRALAGGSLLASATVLVRLPGVLAGPGLLLYLALTLRARRAMGADFSWGRTLAAIVLPLLLVLGLHFAVNQAKWGAWLGSPMVLEAFSSRSSTWVGLWGFLLSPGIGLFAYSPLLLLLPWTAAALWRRFPTECAAGAVVCLTYLLFFAGFGQWTGLWSSPGPRYLYLPGLLLMLPLGPWLDGERGRIARVSVVALALVGLAVQLSLLTASWPISVRLAGYADYRPQFAFLFMPDASPILAMARASLAGYVDMWLVKLASGWPGQAGQPVAAASIGSLLVLGVAAAGRRLWRLVRSADSGDNPPGTSA